jgi:hypothetical protein
MEFKFEKIIIWQKAMEFGESINKLSYTFPKDEFKKHYEISFNLMNMMVAFKKN